MIDGKDILIVSACDTIFNKINEIVSQKTSEYNCSYLDSIEKLVNNFQCSVPDILIIDSDTITFHELNSIYNLISTDQLSVIIVSSNVNDAIECFDLGIINDFILKPIFPERLILALKRSVIKSIQTDTNFPKNYTYFKEGRCLKKVFWNDIIYIEGYGIYSKLHTSKCVIVVNESISLVLEKLPSKIFKRIQKSYIVNTTKIVSIKSNAINMDICELPIGAIYKPFIEKFIELN